MPKLLGNKSFNMDWIVIYNLDVASIITVFLQVDTSLAELFDDFYLAWHAPKKIPMKITGISNKRAQRIQMNSAP